MSRTLLKLAVFVGTSLLKTAVCHNIQKARRQRMQEKERDGKSGRDREREVRERLPSLVSVSLRG